ncbi:MAG: hypothetical protein WD845_09465 [Pirellulales bacterium]
MKRSSYSLATVFLVVAIIGVSAASLRGLWLREGAAPTPDAWVLVVAGAVGGALFAWALSIWTRTGSAFSRRNFVRTQLMRLSGLLLGAAAGAQATAQVSWFALLLTPPIIVGCAALVTANRRRQRHLALLRPAPSSSNRPVAVHPLDRPEPEPLHQNGGPADGMALVERPR